MKRAGTYSSRHRENRLDIYWIHPRSLKQSVSTQHQSKETSVNCNNIGI